MARNDDDTDGRSRWDPELDDSQPGRSRGEGKGSGSNDGWNRRPWPAPAVADNRHGQAWMETWIEWTQDDWDVWRAGPSVSAMMAPKAAAPPYHPAVPPPTAAAVTPDPKAAPLPADPWRSAVAVMGINHFIAIRNGLTRSCVQHSLAMRWLSEGLEVQCRTWVMLSNDGTCLIPKIMMAHVGATAFTWALGDDGLIDVARAWPWHWQHLVAQMDDASMKLVVLGPEGTNRSRGLVRCWLKKSVVFDHTRPAAVYQEGRRVVRSRFADWYFILERDDGTMCGVRPSAWGRHGSGYSTPRTSWRQRLQYTEDVTTLLGRGGTSASCQVSDTHLHKKWKDFRRALDNSSLQFDGCWPCNRHPGPSIAIVGPS